MRMNSRAKFKRDKNHRSSGRAFEELIKFEDALGLYENGGYFG